MAQENRYRDADKNMYSIPQPQMPEYYRYTDIGLNSDGSFKTSITITESDPIYFVAWLGETTNTTDGLEITNNSGTSILMIARSYYTLSKNTINGVIIQDANDARRPLFNDYGGQGTAMFALQDNQTINISESNPCFGSYATQIIGIIHIRPLFVS